jgi:hypothetical protein
MARVPAGLRGLGRPRLLDVAPGASARSRDRLPAWLVVADAPLDKFGEDAINRGLSDLDWVSRAAVAHEAVIEAFIDAAALLPMKLFTIFASDERAREHVGGSRIDAIVRRVAHHQEWGLRIMLDRGGPRTIPAGPKTPDGKGRRTPGEKFLMRKKADRDASAELAGRAQETVSALYDRLSAHAREAKRRAASELPVSGGPLLLDAAFLVPVAKSARFQTAVGREARTLAQHGYHVTLSGPWPPYSFVQD